MEDGRWGAGLAVDGDATTRWSSAFADPQWLTVDLGDTWSLTTVNILWQSAHATAYHVDVSTDGSSWRTVHTDSAATGGEVTIPTAGAAARYVRVLGTARNGGYGYSILELRVF
ncbi:hypothetical protein J2S42_001013 [Catenuloplanes indicus]|uniref:F5/8 type C domain-containing protein n=1 Tax=Catenuloplanes indicus TaxID=137267 RepID=A0AAE3VV95_9ACTN|nr:hypothetical protein [Catenuloplanes indicus]